MEDDGLTGYERFKRDALRILGHEDPGPVGLAWNQMTEQQRRNWLTLASASDGQISTACRKYWKDLTDMTRSQVTTAIRGAARRASAILKAA